MTIELLRNNIEREKQIAATIINFNEKLKDMRSMDQKKLIAKAMDALLIELRIVNDAIPELLNNISFYKQLPDNELEPEIKKQLVNVQYNEQDKNKSLAIKKKDQANFVKSISVSLFSEKKLGITRGGGISKNMQAYVEFSNRFFKKMADSISDSDLFKFVKDDLRRITSPFIINTYISMMLMTTILSIILGVIFGVVLILLSMPVIYAVGLMIFLPVFVFVTFLLYPSSTRSNLEKNINRELPFLTIYLAAIATSGIEPSKIFTILTSTKDYPYSQREIKKLINYVNFYGYDLVGALKVVSRGCPSERLAMLFDGLSTTITSGGELATFLNKHSETLLFDYRLEREKYTRISETYMDIYISVIIAAPMILMMVFILMSLTNFATSLLNPSILSLLVIGVISFLNAAFILFLNIKQPKF